MNKDGKECRQTEVAFQRFNSAKDGKVKHVEKTLSTQVIQL